MAEKKKKPSFVTEFELIVTSQAEKELDARFKSGRHLYNAVLGEAIIRVQQVPNSEPYQEAKKIKVKSDDDNKLRNELFATARKQLRFSDFELQEFATITAKSAKWIAEKLDSHTIQKIGTRAFKAAERVLFGKARKVRFKSFHAFHSLESKTNASGIRFFGGNDCCIKWGKNLTIPIRFPNKWNEVLEYGYRSPVKYCRILWREINGKRRWYVQLINEGVPYKETPAYKLHNKVNPNTGLVGIDLNVSNVAVVSDDKAGLLPFAENVPTFEQEIKTLQRKMERSRRATNLDNYEPDFEKRVGRNNKRKKGKVKKGSRRWRQSNAYKKYARKKRELERKKAAYSKSKNRGLANKIVRDFGNNIKAEKVSVRAWQRRYGKAISAKSPGFFQSELARKAESAGGKFTTFSTNKTALSQTHLDGTRMKKSLSERVHKDASGFEMQRDLFSAYLSRYVNDNSELNVSQARRDWERTEPFLTQAWSEFKTASTKTSSKSGGVISPAEQNCVKTKQPNQIALNKGKKLGKNGISNNSVVSPESP
ncbi:transposase, IS608 family protein [Calothrix sp. NIES-4071]|nr:transposase, IS608 family protein [Calothrix sp. NIES-4071]BAZ55300.1 transposase, IS608 family protein [Calothrix sp. NIES-4105]